MSYSELKRQAEREKGGGGRKCCGNKDNIIEKKDILFVLERDERTESCLRWV